jgi:AraC-like DNA-binding protein
LVVSFIGFRQTRPVPAITVRSVRCQRSVSWTAVAGVDGFELCMVRQGSFRLRSRYHDLLVDPTVGVMAGPDEVADVAHPRGSGDKYTLIVLSASAWAAIAAEDLRTPSVVGCGPGLTRLHLRLATAVDRGHDRLAEEIAVAAVAQAIASSEPARVNVGMPHERHRRELVDDARSVLAADPTLDSVLALARTVGCSPHHLSRLFRRTTGLTLTKYRWLLRVHQALDLLAEGEPSIAEVAAECGFADHAHLTRSLRTYLDATPSELRREAAGALG